MKDRAAILTVGRTADAAYWFDRGIGGFVTSSWYRSTLPEWLQRFNGEKLPASSLGTRWTSSLHPNAPPFVQLPTMASPAFYAVWSGTLDANNVLEKLAEAALNGEKLGHHEGTDVLSVSFSANDVLGHRVGPDAPEVEEMSIQTDRTIGRLLKAAATEAGGLQNVLVVFTADHGVARPRGQCSAEAPGPPDRGGQTVAEG